MTQTEHLHKHFEVHRPKIERPADMRPHHPGVFLRRSVEYGANDEAVPAREAVVGRWGLIRAMKKADGLDEAGKLSTFNSRGEMAAKSFTFGNAWRRAQHCIIPANAIFKSDWRSGDAVATRFTRVDSEPLGIAGLWDHWSDTAGQVQESYTMQTINADNDPLVSGLSPGRQGKGHGLDLRGTHVWRLTDSTRSSDARIASALPRRQARLHPYEVIITRTN